MAAVKKMRMMIWTFELATKMLSDNVNKVTGTDAFRFMKMTDAVGTKYLYAVKRDK